MNTLEAKINLLANVKATPCISIFLPIEKSWPKSKMNVLNFRNLLTRVEGHLHKKGFDEQLIQRLLSGPKRAAESEELYRLPLSSIAYFICPNLEYRLDLDITLDTSYHVGNYFDIKPLLEQMTREDFYILSLNLSSIDFFHIENNQFKRVELSDLPRSLGETTAFDNFEKSKQLHQIGTSESPTHIRHGQGGKKDYQQVQINEFCKHIENQITAYLASGSKPLFVVGPEQVISAYKSVSHYRHTELWEGDIQSENDLPSYIMDIQSFLQERKKGRIQQELNRQQPIEVSKDYDITSVVQMAHEGQLKKIFVDTQDYIWGDYNAKTHASHIHKTHESFSEDLVSEVVNETIRHGGTCEKLPESYKQSGVRVLALRH